MVSRANLVPDPLFLRSGHGQVTMFLYISIKLMLFSVLTRKGKVPRQSIHHPRSQSWLRAGRAQLTAPSGPGPQTLLSVISEGARHPTQLALRLLRPPEWGETRSHRLQLRQMTTAISSQRKERGRGSPLPQGLGRG